MTLRFRRSYIVLPAGFAFILAIINAWAPHPTIAEEPPSNGVLQADFASEMGTWSGNNPALGLPTPHGPFQLLHDNGTFTTGIDDGCGSQSPRNTSQIESGHNIYGFGATDISNARLADDFVVPAGQNWLPTQLKWYAYQTQTPGINPPINTLTGVNIQIWSGTPGAGGSVVAGDTSTLVPLTSNTFSGIYRVTSTTLTNCQRAVFELTADLTQLSPPIPAGGLPPGTYWVDVQLSGSIVANVLCSPTVPSHQGGDQDNGRQSLDDGVTWVAATDSGDSMGADFPFKLYGEPGPSKSPSVFTYQGRLSNVSGGLDGLADLKFTVHYAETGNFAAGPPSQVDNVPVNDGLFTANVELPADINPELFWWLEIDVRHPAGSGSFVTLSPRQRMTTAPRARFADTCNVLTNSAQVPWSQLSGVPFGFSDGIDNEGPWNMHPGGSLYYNNSVAIGNLVPTARLHIGGVAGTDGIRFPDNTLQTTAYSAGSGQWQLSGNSGTIPGTNFLGTTNNQPLDIRSNNQRGMRIQYHFIENGAVDDHTINVIGGSDTNAVSAGVGGATIGGGGRRLTNGILMGHTIHDDFGTIAGGDNNVVGNDDGDTDSQIYATVGGGTSNTAAGTMSTVSGGSANVASGNLSVVPGGAFNQAGGDYSFAAGRRGKVRDAATVGDADGDQGTFVWADSQNADFVSTAANQFLIRAAGGVGIGTAMPLARLHVVTEPLSLQPSALEVDDIIIESTDAVLGLYSTAGGLASSAVALKEIDATGLIVNTWGIYRRTTSGGNGLRFSFGTSDNYANNPTMMEIGSTGNVSFAGTLTATGANSSIKAFKIDHPLDPENKYLMHSSVESPDMMNVYNGNVVTDATGYATITLPDWFESLNRDFRYQLTVIDDGADGADWALARVAREIEENKFTIRTSSGSVKVSWQVTGIRKDAVANARRIQTEIDKEPENKGRYLNPEAFGLPHERSIFVSQEQGVAAESETDNGRGDSDANGGGQ